MGKRVIPCFWLEPTNLGEVFLRRYRYFKPGSTGVLCSKRNGLHDMSVVLGQEEIESEWLGADIRPQLSHDDPRWPKKCDCGFEFDDKSEWQHHWHRLFRRADNGELTTLHAAPAGAMWYGDWWPDKGPDGHCLYVMLPGGVQWSVDGPANNCTRKGDKAHRCWPRRGKPPLVTVNKDFGPTCSAGAGSISVPGFHGFLREGKLVEC